MELDKRLPWEYKGCEIIPIDTQHPIQYQGIFEAVRLMWEKCGEPIDFGNVYRRRYWRMNFPDGSHLHAGTKPECREYIDKNAGRWGLKST